MGVVRGLLIEESLLFPEQQHDDSGGNLSLPPKSATLLRTLKHSNLPHLGICYRENVSSQKAAFLTKTAASYSFDCISLPASLTSNALNELSAAWAGVGETCVYVTSTEDGELSSELRRQGWSIICIREDRDNGSALNREVLFIQKLEELLTTICSFSKMGVQDTSLLMIGYVMKASREEDFAKRGAFPLYPTQNGLIFVPLTFELPLAPQLRQVDAVLHKATDEIINVNLSSLDLSESISFSNGMCELERYIYAHPDCCLIDPLNNIYPLLDRQKIQHILLELEDLNIRDHSKLRAPHFLKVDSFQDPNIRENLSEAKLLLPVIIKPQVACGVADAHNMALVFKIEDFEGLDVPLPAIVQEYVDHGSCLFKFYVLGDKIFHTVKKSMPNAKYLSSSLSDKPGFGAVHFNSLKSLPVAKEDQQSADGIRAGTESLDVDLVNNAARWLRKRLELTIFGFDVVIQEDSGDHVIVDLNYLPSFKEVPDNDAMPAFWEAIKGSYESIKEKRSRETFL